MQQDGRLVEGFVRSRSFGKFNGSSRCWSILPPGVRTPVTRVGDSMSRMIFPGLLLGFSRRKLVELAPSSLMQAVNSLTLN